jgi:hypothetical protein
LLTPNKCYDLRSDLSQSGDLITIEMQARVTSPECTDSGLGVHTYSLSTTRYRSGNYLVRIIHVVDGAAPGSPGAEERVSLDVKVVRGLILAAGVLILGTGCSDPAGPQVCRGGADIQLDAGNCLTFQDEGRLTAQHVAIEQVVRETLVAVRQLLPITGVSIRISSGPAYIIPEIGLGGRTNGTSDVQISVDPLYTSLARAVDSDLFPLLAHELHHIARHRQFGLSSNLLEAMVMEGLADHFSIEVASVDPPPWAVALTPTEIDHWIEQARPGWLNGEYDHDRWFFGVDPTIPRWAGYSVGFDMVDRYLDTHPTARPSQLAGEPALTFIPRN